jgi:glycosyltransferase involved in cell wall biosynthesis
MGNKTMKLWILHAGLGHPSPYFYNLCNEFNKYKDIEVIVKPDLPLEVTVDNGVVYFNRLKRYYDSEDMNSIHKFLDDVDKLKQNGWKLIFTLHNFFPIDRKITENDEFLLTEFLPKMDVVFTFTNYMKQELKQHFGINAINHSIGKNTLDKSFDKEVIIPEIKNGSFVFTFVGNISEYKMLDIVINEFKKIKNNNVYLIIAGLESKNFKLNYEEEKSIIRINQFIGDSCWKKLCSITNVFINSYDVNRECFKYGFFPSNCIQIMQQKKICIVPKCKVMSEILPCGFYYTYENNSEILKVMKQVINDENIIKEKENNYPCCNYSWENMVKIIVSSIRGI